MNSKEVFTAPAILALAADAMRERAAARDTSDGERSMARCVAMFNAYAGGDRRMTETDGWMFMVFLKAARAAQGKVNEDDYVDGAAYFALAGESATRSASETTSAGTGPATVWNPWVEGVCMPSGAVEVILRSGERTVADATHLRWAHTGTADDIVAYRYRSEP